MARSLRTVGRARKGRRAFAAAAAIILSGGLAACSSSHTVASRAQQIYVSVPPGWKVFSASSLDKDSSLHSLITTRPKFLAVASANPRPRAADAFSSTRYPWAIALVRPLTKAERTQLSLESLTDVLVPVDELSQLGDNVQVLGQPTEQVKGALHGIVLSVELQGPSGGRDRVRAVDMGQLGHEQDMVADGRLFPFVLPTAAVGHQQRCGHLFRNR